MMTVSAICFAAAAAEHKKFLLQMRISPSKNLIIFNKRNQCLSV